MQQYTGSKPDEGLDVEFYWGATQDSVASLTLKEGKEKFPGLPEDTFKGRPVFKDVPWVRIRMAGNRDEIIDTVAWLSTDEGVSTEATTHDRRFPVAWARFQAQSTDTVSGFPLKEWAGLTRAAVETFALYNVRTVEQLANLTDGNLQNVPLPNTMELREKARTFLEQAASGESLRAELMQLRAQVEAMKPQASPAHVSVVPPHAVEAVFTPTPEATPAEAPNAPKKRGRPAKAKASPEAA
jgi:hypothetical protein